MRLGRDQEVPFLGDDRAHVQRFVMASLALCLAVASPDRAFARDDVSLGTARRPAPPATSSRQQQSHRPTHETRSIRGRVVWLAEGLHRRYGVRTVPEAQQRVLALETPEGLLYPLVEDVRGRAFRRDERLRDVPVELLVRQYYGSPVVQVIRVYVLKKDGKYELDYWCDICAITMFELKPCDCCQGPIELRARHSDH
jgi:hypothetical protein